MSAPSLNFSSFADMYEHVLVGPLFSQWVDDLLRRTELTAGEHVLDVACGTGIVARRARQRVGADARVIGVDPSAPMLAVARQAAPDIDWREGNAAALPIGDDEQVDVVFCQQGLQFVADKAAAAREMRRVLRGRGRVAVATWLPLDDVPMCRDLHAVAARHLGSVVDQRHTFGVAAAVVALLTEAGFRDVRAETVSRTVHFDDPTLFFQMNANAITGMSEAGKNMSDADRAGVVALIAADSRTLLSRYGDGAGVSFELSANVATGRV